MKNKYDIEDPVEYYNSMWTDKKHGWGIMFIGSWLIGIVGIALISLGKIAISIFNIGADLTIFYFLIMALISALICNFLVFKNDKYLRYFEVFERWTKTEKRLNIFLSVCCILFIIALFFISLIYFE